MGVSGRPVGGVETNFEPRQHVSKSVFIQGHSALSVHACNKWAQFRGWRQRDEKGDQVVPGGAFEAGKIYNVSNQVGHTLNPRSARLADILHLHKVGEKTERQPSDGPNYRHKSGEIDWDY